MPLKSNINKIRAGLRGETAAGNYESAEQIADLEAQLAPKDTGELAASVQVEGDPSDLTHVVTAGRGLPDIRALAQEYGTIDQPAQPYATPAARAIKPAINIAKRLQALYRSNGL